MLAISSVRITVPLVFVLEASVDLLGKISNTVTAVLIAPLRPFLIKPSFPGEKIFLVWEEGREEEKTPHTAVCFGGCDVRFLRESVVKLVPWLAGWVLRADGFPNRIDSLEICWRNMECFSALVYTCLSHLVESCLWSIQEQLQKKNEFGKCSVIFRDYFI